jgi:hypothetical protein
VVEPLLVGEVAIDCDEHIADGLQQPQQGPVVLVRPTVVLNPTNVSEAR